ncbi:MAG: hypothetical protein LQ352_003142 [Teloschistes flavicans]|nr:MAG: hypothetical protein LQ352_003142 [Teloschistes flavicans]
MEQKDVPRHDPPQPADAKNPRSSPASFISRIGASASGLVRDAVVHPNFGALANELNDSVSSNAAKGSASGSTARPSASSIALQSSLPARPFPPVTAPGLGSLGCRSDPDSRGRLEATDDYRSFISLPSGPDQNEDQPTVLPAPPLAELSDTQFRGHAGAKRSSLASPPVEDSQMHQPGENPADGAAVVALLADPTFCIDHVPEDPLASGLPDCNTGEVSSISKTISTPTAMEVLELVNPLALIPDFRDCLD